MFQYTNSPIRSLPNLTQNIFCWTYLESRPTSDTKQFVVDIILSNPEKPIFLTWHQRAYAEPITTYDFFGNLFAKINFWYNIDAIIPNLP